VGIWLSASLVNPYAIGSLLRVFFWAWFAEWVVFIIEVVLIIIYYLTWQRWQGPRKLTHLRLGGALALFSWLTMAIITGILGFMMQSGTWLHNESFWAAFLNPLYLPQLGFRTTFAPLLAGMFFLFLLPFLTARGSTLRAWAVRAISIWSLFWLGWSALTAPVYWLAVPRVMQLNAPAAIASQQYLSWHTTLQWLILAAVISILVIAVWGLSQPRRFPSWLALVPFLLAMALTGYFERVREFIRKPWVIEEYMYSNGLRAADYPLYRQDGLLRHSSFTTVGEITPDNRLEAGREVFRVACSRCHTTNGVNGLRGRLTVLFGEDPWTKDEIKAYVSGMHNVLQFMPPFPGSDDELDALAEYALSLQENPLHLPGAQSAPLNRQAGGAR
jgi:mono/diheme cytochrome c family protein